MMFLACTGSEANEIALRMATVCTGHRGIICTRFAYHGNTTAVAQISTVFPPPEGMGEHIRAVPVPDSYREAGMALGATRWQLVYRVLLPAARNGLLAAVLLGIGRAVGETMAVLMATGHAVHIPTSLLDSVRTLTANIAAELGEAPAGSDHYRVLFLTGTLLFLITFAVNLAADFVVRGIRRR